MTTDNGLFHIESLEEILETCLYTGCVRSENPVSIIIVGPSGIGKSMMLSRYQSPALQLTDSISSQGLYDVAVKDAKNELKFLLIPDMNPTLSRKPSTVQATIANLLSFTADGTVRIDDGRRQKECKHPPVGIVTAATSEIYMKQANRWFALGLRRRMLPIFFRYSPETVRKLKTLVASDKIHSTQPPKKSIRLNMTVLPSISTGHEQAIAVLADKLAMLLGKTRQTRAAVKKYFIQDVVPISPQISLKTLMRAHALRDGRGATNEKDYAFLLSFLDYCDPEHPREI